MSPRAPIAAVLAGLAGVAAGLAGCASTRDAPPATTRTAAPGALTPAYAAMRGVLLDGAPARERGDAAALRQLAPELAATALALLRARMPHDLRRADVARYQEGRAVFGAALKRWVCAVERGDDAAVLRSFDDLTEAYWGWVDAAKGLEPERAV